MFSSTPYRLTARSRLSFAKTPRRVKIFVLSPVVTMLDARSQSWPALRNNAATKYQRGSRTTESIAERRSFDAPMAPHAAASKAVSIPANMHTICNRLWTRAVPHSGISKRSSADDVAPNADPTRANATRQADNFNP